MWFNVRRSLSLIVPLALVGLARVGTAGAPAATPARQEALVADSIPMIKSWVPAAFPKTVAADTHGRALVRIVVDEHGGIASSEVVEATADAFGEAALAAIRQWTFAPGIDEGKPAAMSVDVPFNFDPERPLKAGLLPPQEMMPKLSPRTSADVEDAPLGEYPASLVGRGLPGDVTFSCRVSAEGKPSRLRILRASHADFVVAAIESSARWRFKPGMQGNLKVAGELTGDITYSDVKTPTRDKVLAANGITGADGTMPEYSPAPIYFVEPVYPYERLLAGEGGSAAVEFTVSASGEVRDVKLREASHPEFGDALVAAVRSWAFDPAVKDGTCIDVALVKRFEFKPVPKGTSEADDPRARLVELGRGNAIHGGKGLDAKVVPVYTVAPVSPDGSKGTVVVEFVIDRDGRARLPRVVSASSQTLGWAALTAVSQWVFNAPTRGGEPTEAKVQLPVTF
jgi:TonB family protein